MEVNTDIYKLPYKEFLEESYKHFIGIVGDIYKGDGLYDSTVNIKTLEALALQSLVRIRKELERLRECDGVINESET
jgi:hypothetical protein